MGTLDGALAQSVPQKSKKYPTIASQATATKLKRLTLDQYFDWWITNHTGQYNTTNNYRYVYETHISPFLGSVTVSSLTTQKVHAYMQRMVEEKTPQGRQRTGNTLNRTAKVLRYLYVPLEEWGLPNPAKRAGGYSEEHRQVQVLDLGDEQRLLKALPNDGARCLVELIWDTGCRVGEATALHVSDIGKPDPALGNRAPVSISKSVYFVDKNEAREKSTKKGQARTSSISADLYERIQDLIKANEIGLKDILFQEAWCAHSGKKLPMERDESWTFKDLERYAKTAECVSPSTVVKHGTVSGYTYMGCRCEACTAALRLNRRKLREEKIKRPVKVNRKPRDPRMRARQVRQLIQAACKKAGLPPMTTHWLRHTRVTLLVEAGLTYKEIGSVTGQVPKTIENIYEHRTNKAQARIMKAMNLDSESPKPSSASAKFCPECGSKRESAKFCPECGYQF